MKLFLPWMGWHVKFKQAVEEYAGKVFDDLESANTNILEEPEDEAVLSADFDVNKFVQKGITEWVQPIYFWTSEDPVGFPEDAQGEEIEVCAGHSLVFHDRDECLADLAKVHEPVAWLLGIQESGPAVAQPLARSVLEGDREALHVLADALEEADHPRAAEVRELATAEGKPKKKSKKPKAIVVPEQPPPKVSPVKHRVQVQHKGGVFGVCFIPNSTRFALLGYSVIEICEVAGAKKVHRLELPTYETRAMAVSPDGRLIAAGTLDGEWVVYDTASGREVSGRYVRSRIRHLAFSPDSTCIASISDNGTLGRWDARTGATRFIGYGGEGSAGLAFLPDGTLLNVTPGQVQFWSATSGERSRDSLAVPGVPLASAVSADGNRIGIAFDDLTLRILDLTSGDEPLRVTTTLAVRSVAFSPDGSLVAVGDVSPGNVFLFDTTTGVQRFGRGLHNSEDSLVVAFSPDGTQLATSAEDNFCRLWSVADLVTPVAKKEPAEMAKKKPPAKAVEQEVVLIGGYPASGKSTYARQFVERGYERLNRDEMGGSMDKLLGPLAEMLDAGKSVVLDNLYANKAARADVVKLARRRDLPVRFLLMDTTLEDAQFNASLRMMEKAGRLLEVDDHKKPEFKKDPGFFPVFVIYKYRKDFEKPTVAEGFSAVESIAFERHYPKDWKKKAMIFDMDGTLRTNTGSEKYPTKVSEVQAFKERGAKLKKLQKEGYLLLAVSNQSGIAKKKLTREDAEACFKETAKQLGVKFEAMLYCPHSVPPLSCYCRKPNPGLGVQLMWDYKLDPRLCTFVGDLGTDKSFAERCGFTFVDQEEFFA